MAYIQTHTKVSLGLLESSECYKISSRKKQNLNQKKSVDNGSNAKSLLLGLISLRSDILLGGGGNLSRMILAPNKFDM